MTSEFDRQLQTLLSKGYPALVGLSESQFGASLEPLRPLAPANDAELSFAIVVTGFPIKLGVERIELNGAVGFTDMTPVDPNQFTPIESLHVPNTLAYLITDIDLGHDTLNVTPDDALPRILNAGRSPLTITEGLAIVTQFPNGLKKHNAFSMLGSRCGDKRVPAFWVSQKKPRLGWCWAGNPHTWLGSASCASRLAP